MKRSTRLLIALGVIEVLLAGLWLWMMVGIRSGSLTTSGSPQEAIGSISSTMGTVMGVLLGVVLVAVVVLRGKGQ